MSRGPGGLTKLLLDAPAAQGAIYLHGAHVAHWQPNGHTPVLWMSRQSNYAEDKPIRGGVPICFPWFGPNLQDSKAPAHGLARLHAWKLSAVARTSSQGIACELTADLAPFQLTYRVEFDQVLRLSLTTRLSSSHDRPARYEDALHTYFAVSDVRNITIEGLQSVDYIDKVDQAKKKTATGEAIQITSETDRVYLNTTHACRLLDPGQHRTILVEKTGSRSTIVWNPWIDKSAKMPDFGDDEWPEMVCIETANVGDHAIELQPGGAHKTMP